MVLFLLCIKAELDGVESLSLVTNTNLCFSVKNPLSDYETRDKIVFNPSETLDQDENDREPPHHFALKWDGSKKYSTLTVLSIDEAKSVMKKLSKKGSGKNKGANNDGGEVGIPRELTSDDSGNYVPVLAMECRGLEPYAFHILGNEFQVDLSDGDWGEYDEEYDAAVGVNDFTSKIITV